MNSKKQILTLVCFVALALNSNVLRADEVPVPGVPFPPTKNTQTLTLFSTYTEFGYCSGSDFNFCSNDLIREGENMALQQSVSECQSRQGSPAENANCSSFCTPFNLPFDAPLQSVNCSVNCYLDCQLNQ